MSFHQLWDLLEGKKLFEEVDPLQVQEYDELNHLAHISALLGPPPKELLDKGTRTDRFYKPDGEYVPRPVSEYSLICIYTRVQRHSCRAVNLQL